MNALRLVALLLALAIGAACDRQGGTDTAAVPEGIAIRFSAIADEEGADLALVLWTLGNRQGTALRGEAPACVAVLDPDALASLDEPCLRAYGYDADRRLRWVRYEVLDLTVESAEVRLRPLDLQQGFPMPPAYPNHALTSSYRIFAAQDTLRDAEGIPLCRIWCFDEPVCFRHWVEKVILSNFENYLISGADSCKARALTLTDWLLARAMPTPLDGLAFPEVFDYPGHVLLPAPWNGSFTQGLTLSVLLRAHLLTGEERYRAAAESAMRAATVPTGHPGGSLIVTPGDLIWLEEYPSFPPQHTLNGAIYGLWSILDWWSHTGDPTAERCYRAFIRTLEQDLPRFDTGDWTRYDLWGSIATASYHQQHVFQMERLYSQTGLPIFQHFYALWASYLDASDLDAICLDEALLPSSPLAPRP